MSDLRFSVREIWDKTMIFHDVLAHIWAFLTNYSPECVRRGHKIKTTESDRLLHQKGGAQPIVDVFKGTYSECTRTGCRWSRADVVHTGKMTVSEMEKLFRGKKRAR